MPENFEKKSQESHYVRGKLVSEILKLAFIVKTLNQDINTKTRRVRKNDVIKYYLFNFTFSQNRLTFIAGSVNPMWMQQQINKNKIFRL